ncbi:rCG32096 [Rattus norvegicus]|uniref:RCG32096 n=1 Tax=Rattus norvegicus TaxID=10116 RepID=A6JXS3_RAT|nr:rCG32096 [Rattus norvegicus]
MCLSKRGSAISKTSAVLTAASYVLMANYTRKRATLKK